MKEKLVAIVGPTAVGKSKIAVEIAGRIGGEIISADSMQVYKGMDIGTAKLHPHEMLASSGVMVPHHLLDILEPDQDFSAAQFQEMARRLISEVNERGLIPILVGGTGLYVQTVIDQYRFDKMKVDPDLRRRLFAEAETRGKDYLYKKLEEIDPASAKKIHKNDLKRVIRALEVFYQTGSPISSRHILDRQRDSLYNLAFIGLWMDRNALYQRINERVDKMIEQGLVAEVKNLLAQGYYPNLNSMQGLGYKQISQYLLGRCTLEEAIANLKRDTRRFAKRQLTWFKRDSRIKWFKVEPENNTNKLVQEIEGEIGRIINN